MYQKRYQAAAATSTRDGQQRTSKLTDVALNGRIESAKIRYQTKIAVIKSFHEFGNAHKKAQAGNAWAFIPDGTRVSKDTVPKSGPARTRTENPLIKSQML
jgi:hypothetical protein